MPLQMIIVIVMGYVFDIFGRRKTIFLNALGSSVVLYVLPLGFPNVSPYVYIIRNLSVIFAIGLTVHPLINDYIQRESRGKANAL